jgi:2-iminobutanoate/2-iminopropanoate deaminase
VFISGQIPIDPATGELVGGEIQQQTRQVMENIKQILESQRLGFADVVKTTIFLKDMGAFSQVNEVYGSYFPGEPPARSTIEVAKLPKNAEIEIETIALFH